MKILTFLTAAFMTILSGAGAYYSEGDGTILGFWLLTAEAAIFTSYLADKFTN